MTEGEITAWDNGEAVIHPATQLQEPDAKAVNVLQSPPTTPKKLVNTEIPSSQSPAESPLSIQTSRSRKDALKSPLRARSINTGLTRDRRGGKAMAITLKEIHDTCDFDKQRSQISTSAFHLQQLVPTHYDSDNKTSPTGKYKSQHDIARRPASDGRSGMIRPYKTSQHSPYQIKTEIRDTDSEGDAISGFGDDEYDAGRDTQVALDYIYDFSSGTHSDFTRTLSTLETKTEHTSASTNGDEDEARSKRTRIRSDFHVRSRSIYRPMPASPVQLSPKIRSTITIVSPTDSEQASAQLFADLDRETEAQDMAAPKNESKVQTDLLEYSPGTPDVHGLVEDDTQLPTLPSPRLTRTSRNQPIHPSQATTVDVTQQSPRRRTGHPVSSQMALPLSLPAFAFSSSPVRGNYGGQNSSPHWDGNLLTESQMLPDSIMNFTMPQPPEWIGTQESVIDE
jgi:hypothetical protein